jgi:predicted dehydrogenase
MALPVRFSPPHWTAKRLADEGAVGRLAAVHAVRSHNLHPATRSPWELTCRDNGGPLVDLGSHDYDFVAWCMGRRPVAVAANQALLRYADLTEFADAAQMFVRFADGTSATVWSDWLTPDGTKGTTSGVLLVGTEGAMRIDEGTRQLHLLRPGRDWEVVQNDREVPNLSADFLRAIAGEAHVVTTEECLEVSRVLLTAAEAARTGQVMGLSGPEGA